MRALRFMLEVFLFVVLFPWIVIFEIVWLVKCIKMARVLEGNVKDGIDLWVKYIKVGLEMNKDFVMNGLKN